MKLRMDCLQASRRLSERQDHPLPAAEEARLRLHLVMCEACRRADEQLGFLRRAMRRWQDDERRDEGPRRD